MIKANSLWWQDPTWIFSSRINLLVWGLTAPQLWPAPAIVTRLVSALLITAGIIMLLAPGQNVETRERVNNWESKLSPNKQCSVRAQSALNIIPVCLSAFSVYQLLCISHLKTWETCNNKIFSSFLFLNPLFMISPPKSSINLWALMYQ